MFRGLRLAPARKTPLVDQLRSVVSQTALVVRTWFSPGLVITTSFSYSRGILDVVAPVREVELGSASHMREVNK